MYTGFIVPSLPGSRLDDRKAYCPYCRSEQPHRYASDELGGVLWCQSCFTVHTQGAEACGDCHYWHLSQCVNALAMVSARPPGACPYRRPRRTIPAPPIDF